MNEKQSNNDAKILNTILLSDQRIDLKQELLGEANCCKVKSEIMSITTTLTYMKEEICNLPKKIYEISKIQGKMDKPRNHFKKHNNSSNESSQEKDFLIKQKQSNLKSSVYTELICNIETSLTNTINCIEKRFQNFEEYVRCSLRSIDDNIKKNNFEEKLNKYIHDVYMEFEDIKTEMKNLQHKDKKNKAIEEELEVLKIVKAEKDVIEEALVGKADICALNKKVSHDQFDAVCEDLERSLHDAITKLNKQESVWQQSLFALRSEINVKFDKLEIPVLKEFVTNELQVLKNQLQILSKVKQEQEAAGTKKPLRNLRCISCDKDAFMQTNIKSINASQPFPCRPSIKPYLTFKMDQLRDKKKMLSQRKLIPVGKFTNESLKKNKCDHIETYQNTSDDFCERYCGGSHTMMNPQQRMTTIQKALNNHVTRLDINDMHLVEGFIEGTDGRTYKGKWFLE